MKIRSVILCLSLISTFTAFAGNEGGGGGDARCAEYSDLAGKVAATLKTIGQTEVSKVNGVIDVEEVWRIKRKLVCLPEESLNRQAWSDPSTGVTKLLVSKEGWPSLNATQKLRLVAHELAVLASYENDGEYFISKDMISLVTKKSESFRYYLLGQFASELIINMDGSVTFLNPKVVSHGRDYKVALIMDSQTIQSSSWPTSLAYGFCKHVGFQAQSSNQRYIPINGGADVLYAKLTDKGYLEGIFSSHTNDDVNYFSSITCIN